MQDCSFYEKRILNYYKKGLLLEKLYNEYGKQEANKMYEYIDNQNTVKREIKKKKS